jgi:hypothetical protein
MERLNGGLKDIFSTILKANNEAGDTKPLPPIIVLAGNGNVIAPGGTVHVVSRAHAMEDLVPGGILVPASESQ